MAINSTRHFTTMANGILREDNAIAIDTSSSVRTVTVKGNLAIEMPDGRRINLFDILSRLEALETAYMEDKLLGEEPKKE